MDQSSPATSPVTTPDSVPAFTRFLWWLATADSKVLAYCRSDRGKYSIIGLAVFSTWLFASLAWTYFFYTVSNNIFYALLPGLFMGFIILTIDRVLIKGITAANKRKILPLFFRAVLAICIGSFMAQPAIMYIFNKEISLQVSIDNEARKTQKKNLLDVFYADRKLAMDNEKDRLREQLTSADSIVNKARSEFLAETDGSGGSGKRGVAAIAKAKKAEYDKLNENYFQLKASTQPVLDSAERELAKIDQEQKDEAAIFASQLNEGFLTRATALNNLLKQNTALQYRYYLIVFILVLIELLPVLAKSMLASGSYDAKMLSLERLELAALNKNETRQLTLAQSYYELSRKYDQAAMNKIFENRHQNLNDDISEFENSGAEKQSQNFAGFWQQIRRQLLSSPEF